MLRHSKDGYCHHTLNNGWMDKTKEMEVGQLEIKKLDKYYDVNRLIKEKEYVESRLNYEDGALDIVYLYRIYISSWKSHSEHHNNIPYGNILNSCPYFKKIFDSFKTEVTSFRLLRREKIQKHLMVSIMIRIW